MGDVDHLGPVGRDQPDARAFADPERGERLDEAARFLAHLPDCERRPVDQMQQRTVIARIECVDEDVRGVERPVQHVPHVRSLDPFSVGRVSGRLPRGKHGRQHYQPGAIAVAFRLLRSAFM
jgi:hypothetical protein